MDKPRLKRQCCCLWFESAKPLLAVAPSSAALGELAVAKIAQRLCCGDNISLLAGCVLQPTAPMLPLLLLGCMLVG